MLESEKVVGIIILSIIGNFASTQPEQQCCCFSVGLSPRKQLHSPISVSNLSMNGSRHETVLVRDMAPVLTRYPSHESR